MSQGASFQSLPEGLLPEQDELSAGQRARLTRILDASERLFVSHGLAGTTMEAIAREAAVAKATVYGYLPSKDAAFRAVAERLAGRIEAACLPWLRAPAACLPREEVTTRVISALVAKQEIVFAVVRSSPHAEELFAAKGRYVAERFAELDDRIISGIAELLRNSSSSGARAPSDDDPERLAAVCFRGAIGVANAAPTVDRMIEDVTLFARRFLDE